MASIRISRAGEWDGEGGGGLRGVRRSRAFPRVSREAREGGRESRRGREVG